MSELFEFTFYDSGSQPIPSPVAGFLFYKNRTGGDLTPPSLVVAGGGPLAFTVPDSDYDTGVCFVITGSSGYYPLSFFDSSGDDLGFIYLTADDGTSFVGNGTPAFTTFESRTGTPRTPPAFISVYGSSSWSFTFSQSDLDTGVVYEITSITGSNPPRFNGAMSSSLSGTIISGSGGGSYPVISNITPATGSAITALQIIQLEVTDVDNDLHRVLLAVEFTNNQIKEVVHDGDAFGPRYQNGSCSRTPITNGYSYSILRTGGWIEGPDLTVYAIDNTGREP